MANLIIVNVVHDRYPDVELLKKGVQVLMDRQLDNGDFPLVSLPTFLSLFLPALLSPNADNEKNFFNLMPIVLISLLKSRNNGNPF